MPILGLGLGYTVKYNPLTSGVPSGLTLTGTSSGKGLYLAVYPSSRPNTDTVQLYSEVESENLMNRAYGDPLD